MVGFSERIIVSSAQRVARERSAVGLELFFWMTGKPEVENSMAQRSYNEPAGRNGAGTAGTLPGNELVN